MKRDVLSVEDVPINGFHQFLCVRSGGGWVLDGYVLSIIGVALAHFSSALQLSDFWQGLIAASSLIGIFFGGFVGGWITDRFGRQRPYFLAPIIFVVCSVAQYWIHSAEALFIFRFLIGIGVGIEYPVAGSLLVEFLPSKNRGPRLAMLTILWFVGAAFAYITGNIIISQGGPDAWRLVLASPAVIGVALILIRLGTPESPRWLISKGRYDEADAVIKKVYGPGFSLQNLPEGEPEQEVSFRSLLKSGYGTRLFFVSVFWSCAVIPLFAVYSFAPKVLQGLHLTGAWEAYGSVAITLLFVVGCIIATRLINTLGRRTLVIHSFLWSGLALLGLGAMSDANEMIVLTLFGLYAVFIGGAQVLQLVYPNELFPTEVRSYAVGMSASFSRIGAAVGTWLVPIALTNYGIGHTMYAAAVVSAVGLLVSIALAPETRAMSLQQAASLKR